MDRKYKVNYLNAKKSVSYEELEICWTSDVFTLCFLDMFSVSVEE